MKLFTNYTQEDYLPYLYEIKYYKSSKTQAVLARIFPTEVIEILNLIIRDYETKTAAENSQSVYHGIIFSTKYVKQQTGLSYSKQQRALNLLAEYGAVEVTFLDVRWVCLNYEYITCVNNLVKQYIKLTSKPNYNLFDFIKLYNKHCTYFIDEEPIEEDEEELI